MFLFVLAFFSTVYAVAGSECCTGYYDALGSWHNPQWCDNYCCGTAALKLYCCDSVLLEAPDDYVSDFCELWWSHHVWAPVVSGIVLLGIMICCCVCCYKCCCASNKTTVYVQNPVGMGAPNMSTTIVSSQSSMNSQYNQLVQYDPIKY